MYTGFLHMHSLLRWVLLILLLVTIIKAIIGWVNKDPFGKADNKLALFTMITAHIQLVIGILLYTMSPIVEAGLIDMGATMKNNVLRFWVVEHLSMMLFGIIVITVGRIRAKKLASDVAKHRSIAIFYLVGLLLILSRIPWPFTTVSRPWF